MTTAAPAHLDLTRTALARAAALLAVASAGVHLLLVSSTSLGSAVMAAMALACLPCAWHLWRSPSGSVWALTALVDAGMLAVHAPMLADARPSRRRLGDVAHVARRRPRRRATGPRRGSPPSAAEPITAPTEHPVS